MEKFDAVIVGAGVVGLATACEMSKLYDHVLLIEKNHHFGEETSSRNSEVIHAGIYYPEDSLKAKFCVEGKHLLYRHCEKYNVPARQLGKLLIANGHQEEQALADIVAQAKKNNVPDLTFLSAKQALTLEPAVQSSLAVISPSTGIIDVHQYMQSLLFEFERNGGVYVSQTTFNHARLGAEEYVIDLQSVGESMVIKSPVLINCAGLHARTIASNIEQFEQAIIPLVHYCRGHYFSYSGKSPFSRLIYPIPQQHGLGIHASLDIGGQLKFGPDTQYINEIDYTVAPALIDKFYHAIQAYFPSVNKEKLQPAYAGIRPKLEGEHEGFKDFVIQTEHAHGFKGLVNCFGIDSPGLTSSLAIAKYIAQAL